ncbi:sec63 brl domain-containing protein [Sarocladium implicatum]|nr:sec63 brl domain-containing protein [Sarocladium implicatum]
MATDGLISSSSASKDGAFSATSDGVWDHLKLRYKLAPSSFKNLTTVRRAPSRQDVLRQACFCTEFLAFPFSSADRTFFREINDHCPVPYRITESLTQPWHKVFLLVQVDLAKCGWPNKLSSAARKDLQSEHGRIYRVLDQVLRCLVDILGQRQDGAGVNSALDVLRSVKAGVWEGNDMELLQIQGIGPAKVEKLAQAGIKTVRQLAKLEFYHIERLLSRNPPFGQRLLHQLSGFPLLEIIVQKAEVLSPKDVNEDVSGNGASPGFVVVRLSLRYENTELPLWRKKHPWTTLVVTDSSSQLVWFWRGSVKRFTSRKDLFVRLSAEPVQEVVPAQSGPLRWPPRLESHYSARRFLAASNNSHMGSHTVDSRWTQPVRSS